MKVRVIKSFEMDGNSLPIRAGEEYEVRKLENPFSINPIFQIISGSRSGDKIPFDACVPAPEERTYTEAEYNAIRGQLDQAIEHKRFAESVAKEQKPMELPREVVDALQSFFDDGYDIDHIVKCLLRISPGDGFPRLESIREYAVAHGYEFICALAYGYTAEKTPEERLSNEIEEIILDWHEAPRGEVSVLTQRIVDHLKSIQT